VINFTNNSAGIPVTQFVVEYDVNGGTPVQETYNGNLTQGQSANINFPNINLTPGMSTVNYNVVSVNNGANLFSAGPVAMAPETFAKINATAFATSHTEGFEGFANQTPSPNNALLLNPQGHRVFIIDPTWPGPNSGGYGNSQNSFRWSFIDQSFGNGDYAELLFEKLDFSASTGNEITYAYAHQQAHGSDNNKLQILVSTDCGTTWNLVSERANTNLATSMTTGISAPFYPTSTTWATDTVDLSAYDGNSDVMIAFKGICAGGNNLYIDDIIIDETSSVTPSWDCDPTTANCFDPGTGNGQYTSINDCQANCTGTDVTEITSTLSIYPNPVKDVLNVEGVFELVKIYDIFGKLVLTSRRNSINTENLSEGMYMVNIKTNNTIITKKITITK
jgi:hypothetical protein